MKWPLDNINTNSQDEGDNPSIALDKTGFIKLTCPSQKQPAKKGVRKWDEVILSPSEFQKNELQKDKARPDVIIKEVGKGIRRPH